MQITFMTYLIVCPMVFLAGFVDSIGGGGGLISLPAYLMAGIPPHLAVGTNKFSSCSGTLISTIRYCKNGCVEWKAAVPGILAALAGAQIGARISMAVDDQVLRVILLVLLPVIALYVMFHRRLDTNASEAPLNGKQIALLTVLTFAVGMYDGFYGPGTGTFLLLIYTGLCGMSVRKAGGNMKLANLASNFSSLAVFLPNGLVLLPLGAAAAVFSIAGHYIGSGLAMKNGSRLVRIIILAVIVLLFVKVLIEAVG